MDSHAPVYAPPDNGSSPKRCCLSSLKAQMDASRFRTTTQTVSRLLSSGRIRMPATTNGLWHPPHAPCTHRDPSRWGNANPARIKMLLLLLLSPNKLPPSILRLRLMIVCGILMGWRRGRGRPRGNLSWGIIRLRVGIVALRSLSISMEMEPIRYGR